MTDWPNELPGLDIKLALSQLGGKKNLYLRLLGMFCDTHHQDVDTIVATAQAQDWTKLNEVNHALKGVTGNLAANELYQLCINMDVKLKQDNYDVSNEIQAMPVAMSTLQDSIKIALQLPLD